MKQTASGLVLVALVCIIGSCVSRDRNVSGSSIQSSDVEANCPAAVMGKRFFLIHGFGGGRIEDSETGVFQDYSAGKTILHKKAMSKLYEFSELSKMSHFLAGCGAAEVYEASHKFYNTPTMILDEIGPQLKRFAAKGGFTIVAHSLGQFVGILSYVSFPEIQSNVENFIGIAGVAHGRDVALSTNPEKVNFINNLVATLHPSDAPANYLPRRLKSATLYFLNPFMSDMISSSERSLRDPTLLGQDLCKDLSGDLCQQV